MEYLKNSMAVVQRAVDDMPQSARQMAISTLLKNVAEAPTEVNYQDTITQLINYFDQILQLLKTDRDNKQDLLATDVTNIIHACNDVSRDQDDAYKQNVTDFNQTHFDCRLDEKPLMEAKNSHCNAMLNLMTTIYNNHHYCVFPGDATRESMPAWPAHLENGREHWERNYNDFTNASTDCVDSTDAWTPKHTECDGAQLKFEIAFCQWRGFRLETCDALQSCYDDAVNMHQEVLDIVVPAANTRVSLAAAVKHVKCLVQRIQNGDSLEIPNAGCPFPDAQDGAHQAEFNNTYPFVPEKRECDTEEPHPGEVGFENNYNTLPAPTEAGEIIVCDFNWGA